MSRADSPSAVAGPYREVDVEENLGAQMRDGTVLRSDLYRPRGGTSLPVLVCRTPYGKRGEAFGAGYHATATGLARRGFLVLVQDTRGRYASAGEYRWLYGPEAAAAHAQDGYDTTEWAATIPGSSGQVGTWGNSYDGYTSLRTAGAAPPSLTAAFASGVAERLHHETFGIFKPIYHDWTLGMAADLRARSGRTQPVRPPSADELVWTLPYDSIGEDAFADLTAPFRQFLRDQETDQWALHLTAPDIRVPVCNLTGWWDYVSRGTVAHYVGLQTRGRADVRERHRLVIGPWSHRTGSSAAGDGAIDYGPAEHVNYYDEIADWYDYALKSDDPGSFGRGQVKVFILNDNRWHYSDRWPLEQARLTSYYLHSRGSANTPRGDGRLALEDPVPSSPSTYIYDPREPLMSLSTWSSRAIDQSVNDRRQDVLVYLSDPLERGLLAVGDAACTLWVASDGPETDFTAKLVEVRADGHSIELAVGILRTRYLHGYDQQFVLEPETPYEITIELGPIGIRFEPGSRIRLDISSSDFPNFDRNHNTGSDYWSDPVLRPARQSVFADPARPSRLSLPVCDEL